MIGGFYHLLTDSITFGDFWANLFYREVASPRSDQIDGKQGDPSLLPLFVKAP